MGPVALCFIPRMGPLACAAAYSVIDPHPHPNQRAPQVRVPALNGSMVLGTQSLTAGACAPGTGAITVTCRRPEPRTALPLHVALPRLQRTATRLAGLIIGRQGRMDGPGA